MNILHLYSDWKWTGPAEPVLHMCQGLERQGHNVLLAIRSPEFERDETIEGKAHELGISVTTRFALDRYLHPAHTLRDFIDIPRFLRENAIDIVHMHLSHDHAFGGLCARRLGRQRPKLVRTFHQRTVLDHTFVNRFLIRHFADGYLTFTQGFRQQYMDRFQLAPDCIDVQPMTVDLARFHPDVEVKDMRAEFSIPAAAPLIGIVGRYQSYRRADVFMAAAAKVIAVEPDARFLVIGRSSQIQETVVKPMRELGIEDNVVLTGYRIEDYTDILASLDIFTLLMPGFDGTARAVREAMALGKPCVVSDIGMLPEIVPHEEAGLVVDLDADALAEAWLRLICSPAQRQQFGATAAQQARDRFDVAAVGPSLDAFYQRLVCR